MTPTSFRVIRLQPHIVELILNRPADGTLLSNGHLNLYFTDTTLQLRVEHPEHIAQAEAFIKPLQPLTAIEWHPSFANYLVSNIIDITPNSKALQQLKEYASDKQNHQIVTTEINKRSWAEVRPRISIRAHNIKVNEKCVIIPTAKKLSNFKTKD